MHAFMIIAHNQFELLEKLIKALDDERNDIFVHIDAKVKSFDFKHFELLAHSSRVIFTRKRIDVTWGDYSQVECEAELLKTAYAHSDGGKKYSYYHLISGADFPIKSNDYIHSYFAEHYGSEFVHYSSNSVEPSSVNRLRYYHFFRKKRSTFNKILSQLLLKGQKVLGIDRLKKTDLKVQKGSNWFSITDEFVSCILKELDKYLLHFKYCYCGDEVFVQTLAETTGFCKNLYMPDCNNNHEACMRLIDWKRGTPYVWRVGDFEEIKNSSCIFARKFDLNTDKEIIDKISSELL